MAFEFPLRFSTAVIFLLVAASFAPASAARTLQDITAVTTPPPKTASLVFGTVGPTRFPTLPPGTGTVPTCFGSECVYCPDETGYTAVIVSGQVWPTECSKTYPVPEALGDLADPLGRFPKDSLYKTDTFHLGRDVYERTTSDILSRCFQSTKEILDLEQYGSLSPSIWLIEASGRPWSTPPQVEAWLEQYFKNKKPTVKIFDVSFVSVDAPNVQGAHVTVGVSFTVRAESDAHVVTYRAEYVNPLPVTGDSIEKWTLKTMSGAKVVAKS